MRWFVRGGLIEVEIMFAALLELACTDAFKLTYLTRKRMKLPKKNTTKKNCNRIPITEIQNLQQITTNNNKQTNRNTEIFRMSNERQGRP